MPRLFGNSERPLFGVLHHPERRMPLDGVLLCGALGAESVRTHWLLRQLADRLCRSGRGAFRFDYTGTGDSFGDLADASWSTWIEDTVAAGRELLDEADAPRLSGFGVRLGALALWRGAGELPLRRIVLLDPVLRGDAWIDELAELTSSRLERWKYPRQPLQAAERRELAGFVWPTRLVREVREARWDETPGSFPTPERVTIALTANRVDAELDGFVKRMVERNIHVSVKRLGSSAGWNDPRMMERQLLAGEINEAIFDALTGRADA